MKVLLILFCISVISFAQNEFWDSVDQSEYDFKFAYFDELEVPEDTPEQVAKDLEIQEMKKRADELKKTVTENKKLLDDIKDPSQEQKEEDLQEEITQNVPLSDKDFDVDKTDSRKFSYDPIIQYKEKVNNVNDRERTKNYFLPWEKKYNTLIPKGLMGSLSYSFGSIEENNNSAVVETQKEAQFGFNLNWTFEHQLKKEFFLVFSTNVNYTTASTDQANIELDYDLLIFERIFFPSLRFSYFTPFFDAGLNHFSHLSSLSNTAVLQSHRNKGFLMGAGAAYRVPKRNSEILISGMLRRHFFYTSSPQTIGSDISDISGWEYGLKLDWYFSKWVFFEGLYSKSSFSSSENSNFDLSSSKTYAGFGIKI